MEHTINLWFVIVGALLLVMALSGTVLKRLPLTTSLLYMGVGLVLGPIGFGLIRFDPLIRSSALERIAEVAVLVSLFTAGMKLRTHFSDDRWRPPVRLATLTMVVSVALVTFLGVSLLNLSLGAAVLLGAILAPTDPVLASDVQVEHATDRSRLRFALTGEAGLNDGTAFPFVMLGLGLLGHHELGPLGWRWLVYDVVWAAMAGLAIGWVLGELTGHLTVRLRQRSEQAVGYEDFLALGLIALAYGVALLLHAYGFLAVFAAGLALRHVEMHKTGDDKEPREVIRDAIEDCPDATREKIATSPEAASAYLAQAMLGFAEQAERILEFAIVILVGGLLTYANFGPREIVFVVAMFLFVRPVAVLTTYWGPGAVPLLRPYIAWFGIRGIGSLYYLFYAVEHGLGPELSPRLLSVTLSVIAASVVVHGVSVTPLMKRYSRRREEILERQNADSPPPQKSEEGLRAG